MNHYISTVANRPASYTEPHCWQYDLRLKRLEEDLKTLNMTPTQLEELRTSDLIFRHTQKTQKTKCRQIRHFIERYEWLGKMPNRPTHRFTAEHNNTIVGAVILAVPNTFSTKILGPEYTHRTKLIARGASISWAPKNTASWLIMKTIHWMAKNTEFRIFTGYADPEAKELGTIYQSCNFYYLGQGAGTIKQYYDPQRPHLGWFSDRNFRHKSKYQMYAQQAGIPPHKWKTYMGKWSPNWDKIPPTLKKHIKQEEKKYRQNCKMREVPAKHKYCYIQGATPNETKKMRRKFEELHPNTKMKQGYPTQRGK